MYKVTMEQYWCDFERKQIVKYYSTIEYFMEDLLDEYENRERDSGKFYVFETGIHLSNIYNCRTWGYNGSLWVKKIEDENKIYLEDNKYQEKALQKKEYGEL